MKRFLKKAYLFFLFVLFTNVLISVFLSLNNFFDYSSNGVYSLKYSYFKKNEFKYNMLFFGSSRTYRQINPEIIDKTLEVYKINSFNLGAPATFNPEALSLYEKFLNERVSSKKKYVFLELTQLTPISNLNAFSPRSYYYLDFSNIKFIYEYSQYEDTTFFYSFFRGLIIKYILPLKSYDKKFENRCLGINNDGYYPLDFELKDDKFQLTEIKKRNLEFKRDTLSLSKLKKQSTLNNDVNQVYLNYLSDLIKKSSTKNIQLFFIIPPRTIIPSYLLNNKLSDRIINIGSFNKNESLYLTKNSFDIGHLNSRGANLYSQLLSICIKEKMNVLLKEPVESGQTH